MKPFLTITRHNTYYNICSVPPTYLPTNKYVHSIISREIVSDVTSPLSITFNNRIMEEAFQLVEKNPSTVYHKKLLSVTQYRIAMNICNVRYLLLKIAEFIRRCFNHVWISCVSKGSFAAG